MILSEISVLSFMILRERYIVTTEIRREMEMFQQSVKRLNIGLKQSGAEWNDENFKKLSELIRNIASSSKQVIISGDSVCEALDKFEKIAKENC